MTTLLTLSPFYLSSALPDLTWSTDQQEVHVRLYYQHTGNMLADVTLAASGSTVSLYETREIVERYMRAHALARLYPLQVMHEEEGYWQGDGALTVFFCEKNLVLPLVNGSPSESAWLESHFLSTRTTKVLPSDENAIEQLYFVQPQGTPGDPVLHANFIDGSGTVANIDVTMQANWPVSSSNLYVCEFSIDSVKSAIPVATGCQQVLSIAVQVGDRIMEYFRPARKENLAFRFLNAFNVYESAYLCATVSRETEDGRKFALVAGKLEHYDRKPVTVYEVQTAPLSFEQASWIDQLITSPDVRLLDDTPLIITDGKAECSNDNTKLNAAKFSFKELDQRHTVTYVNPLANVFTVPPHSYQFA